LKKGGLYILGHTIKGDFSSALPELNRQQTSWLRYVDAAKVKAFTNITIAESERLGARSLVLGSGLGGMRPNIIIMGAYNIKSYRDRHHAAHSEASVGASTRLYLPPSRESSRQRNLYLESQLPGDTTRDESSIEPCDYVAIIEDLLQMNKSIGVGFGFDTLETMEASQEEYRKYHRNHKRPPRQQRRYIDVWPIQVASPDDKSSDDPNFKSPLGTYTMILQLATILNMVQQWRKQYRLRVVCFVEHPEDIPEEQRRVVSLLENLRIQAELLVVSLSNSESLSIGVGSSNFVSSYTAITQGKEGVNALVDALVVGTEWWQNTWNSNRKSHESHRQSLDLSSTRAIKSTKSIQDGDSYGAETNTYLYSDPPSDADTEPDVPPNASVRFSQTPFMRPGSSPFDDFERRYSPPPLLSRFTSVPSSLTMRVNLPAVTANSRVHYDSSSSSDDSYSSDEDSTPEGPNSANKHYSKIASRITEPVLDAIGLGKSKLPREEADRHSEEAGLRKLFGKGTTSSPGLVDSSSPSVGRAQDYGSFQKTVTPLKSVSLNTSEQRLEFNDLQSRAQHVIINELMRRISPSERTAVIFSALPAPLSGTHERNQDSITYIENLEVLVQDLPPVMLIHANSLTVTMSL
jgi:solute carrier family 12 (potassium/chloride transporters), member 9